MANITRYNPFEDLFKDFGSGFWVRPLPFAAEADLSIKLDVNENDKLFTVKAEIPGVKKEDIQVDIDDDRVSVRVELKQEKEEKNDEKVVYSERSYGMASRSFTLPSSIDAQGAKAEYKDGVLTLALPKRSNGAAKRVTVS
jgi:HSP20 family protein